MPSPTPTHPSPQRFRTFTHLCTLIVALLSAVLAFLGSISILECLLRIAIAAVASYLAARSYARFLNSAFARRENVEPFIPVVAAAVIPILLMLSLWWSLGGTSLVFATLAPLGTVPILIGLPLATVGFRRRIGNSLHCPKCDYPFTFAAEVDDPGAADTPPRCPECSTPWLGRLARGRKGRSLPLIAIGASIALLGTFILNPTFYLSWLAPHLPTHFLCATTYLSPTSSGPAWDELSARSVGPNWTSLLTRSVLSRRHYNSHEPGSRWLEGLITSGAVPADIADRFYAESFAAQLHVPPAVKAGEPFTVSLRILHAALGGSSQGGIFFAGYYINDQPEPIGRAIETNWTFAMRPDIFESARDVLPQRLIAQHAGTATIRAVYWLEYQPNFSESLRWLPTGEPAPFPNIWSRRYELTQTIRVD